MGLSGNIINIGNMCLYPGDEIYFQLDNPESKFLRGLYFKIITLLLDSLSLNPTFLFP
jgi:hypothetical protein